MTRRIDKPDTDADTTIRACLDKSKSFIMVAGAGSGKTTTLVKALAYIKTTKGNQLQLNGQQVACITYTSVAEKEILSDVGNDPLFQVSTIHSFLWKLIKPFQSDIKKWVKHRIQERLDDLISKRENFSSRVQENTRTKNAEDIQKYEIVLQKINEITRFNYETGSNYLEGILGHDDIIKMGPYLIAEYPLLRKIIAKKYPFFFVDESQDTLGKGRGSILFSIHQWSLSKKFRKAFGLCCLSFSS